MKLLFRSLLLSYLKPAMDSNDANVPDDARQHYEKHMCNQTGCVVPDAPSIVVFFSRMKEDVKIDTVRMIL